MLDVLIATTTVALGSDGEPTAVIHIGTLGPQQPHVDGDEENVDPLPVPSHLPTLIPPLLTVSEAIETLLFRDWLPHDEVIQAIQHIRENAPSEVDEVHPTPDPEMFDTIQAACGTPLCTLHTAHEGLRYTHNRLSTGGHPVLATPADEPILLWRVNAPRANITTSLLTHPVKSV